MYMPQLLIALSLMLNTSLTVESPRTLGANLMCGPRCVHLILQRLGRGEVELHELLERLSISTAGAMPSLSDLASYLEGEGLCTRVIRFEAESPIELTCTEGVYVILHLRKALRFNAEDQRNVGHFVIWFGTKDHSLQQCWDGLFGEVEVPPNALHKLSSGIALVVSDSEQKVRLGYSMEPLRQSWSRNFRMQCCLAAVLLPCAFLIGRRSLL